MRIDGEIIEYAAMKAVTPISQNAISCDLCISKSKPPIAGPIAQAVNDTRRQMLVTLASMLPGTFRRR